MEITDYVDELARKRKIIVSESVNSASKLGANNFLEDFRTCHSLVQKPKFTNQELIEFNRLSADKRCKAKFRKFFNDLRNKYRRMQFAGGALNPKVYQ